MSAIAPRLTRFVDEITMPLSEEEHGFYMRLGFAIAVLSVVFEKVLDLESNLLTERYYLVASTIGFALAVPLVLVERTSRAGVILFGVSILVFVADKWAAYHNHGWLSVWCLPVAALFGAAWWQSELYRWYLRVTLGVVMIAAFTQKIVAGTYLDGSFITYLSGNGSLTEQMFGFMCGPGPYETPCFAHKALGTFIAFWQLAVGILLIAGVRSLIFLFIEIAFLLGAGLYADEMNFQVLNIALLSIAFNYGMRPWLCVICAGLLVIDAYSIEALLRHVI
ncbi:hypothetical protein KHP62_09480 [Rhodobacteraceae bacterium NNCM2]|nr:hypothetical protein [Coraliihabitans acroporae]